MNRIKPGIVLLLAVSAGLGLALTSVLSAAPALASDGATATLGTDSEVVKWAYAAAAATTVGSSLAAGYAVGRVGSAALGTLAEKPELFGRIIVLVGLAEGIAIYGLIVSILILNRLG